MNEKHMKHVASKSRTNWDKLRRGNDRDINYTDIPKTTKDFWKDAELFVPSDKVHLSLRLDEDIVKFFKIKGRGYQTRINSVLKSYIRSHSS